MQNNKLKIIQMPVDEIISYGGNAKIHDAEQIEQIKNSIICFGFNDPICIDENNVIIEGHGRLIALKELGITEVPTIVLRGLNEEQRVAYRLIHNKLTMNSEFDADLLAEELKNIDGLDMEAFGFLMDESESWFSDEEYPERKNKKVVVECSKEDANSLRKWLGDNGYKFKEHSC